VENLNIQEKREKIHILLMQFFETNEDGKFKYTEEEQNKFYDEISKLSPDPYWSDYLFHSNEFFKSQEDFDVQGLIDKMFSYKPILL